MSLKLTIQVYQELATSRGGLCLSERYTNAHGLLRFQCSSGHQWEAKACNVKNNGTWCLVCAGKSPRTIEDARSAARELGGTCLSDVVTSVNDPLTWRCSAGHIWDAVLSNIFYNRTWCRKCAGLAPRTLDDMQTYAAAHGGKCVSAEYINNRTKLTWQCAKGHIFEARYHDKTWCPHCNVPKTENIVRQLCELNTTMPMPKSRPRWLRRATGQQLELDGYSEELGLAFEYQGEQHYERSRHYHRASRDFEDQLRRDEEKRALCSANAVHLIEIPYWADFPSTVGDAVAQFLYLRDNHNSRTL